MAGDAMDQLVANSMGGVLGAMAAGLMAPPQNRGETWKEYALRLQQYNEEWAAHAKNLQAKINWLEDSLKKQSANRLGLDAVRLFLLEELKLVADPEKCKGLDPVERKRRFDAKFQEFMNGDQLSY